MLNLNVRPETIKFLFLIAGTCIGINLIPDCWFKISHPEIYCIKYWKREILRSWHKFCQFVHEIGLKYFCYLKKPHKFSLHVIDDWRLTKIYFVHYKMIERFILQSAKKMLQLHLIFNRHFNIHSQLHLI